MRPRFSRPGAWMIAPLRTTTVCTSASAAILVSTLTGSSTGMPQSTRGPRPPLSSASRVSRVSTTTITSGRPPLVPWPSQRSSRASACRYPFFSIGSDGQPSGTLSANSVATRSFSWLRSFIPRSGSSLPQNSIIPVAGSTRWLNRIARCWRSKRLLPSSSSMRCCSARIIRPNSSALISSASPACASMRSASSLRLSAPTLASAAAAASRCSPETLPWSSASPSLGVSFLVSLRFSARLAFLFDRPAFAIGFSGIGLCLAMYPACATSLPSHHRVIAARSAIAWITSSRLADSSTAATARTNPTMRSASTCTSPRGSDSRSPGEVRYEH